MKKFAVLAIVVLAFLVATSAPVFAGGVGVLVGTWDTESAEDDQGGGVKLKLDLGDNIDFVLRGTWFDGFSQVNDGRVFDIEAFPLDLGLAYDFRPAEKVNPYVGVGGTMLFVSPQAARGEESTSRPRSQEEAGYYVEAGLEIRVAERFSVFGEVLYRGVRAEVRGRDLGTAPQTGFKVDFSGPSASLGLAYSW